MIHVRRMLIPAPSVPLQSKMKSASIAAYGEAVDSSIQSR